MSTLLNAISSLLNSPNTRSSQDGVSTSPVLPQQASAFAPTTQLNPTISSNTALPTLTIPQKVKPVVNELASLAISRAAYKFGPSTVYGAQQTVDVGSKIFQGNVSIDSFVQLQRGLSAVLPGSGVASSKVSSIVNTISSVVNSRLFKAGSQALLDHGTTQLAPAQFSQYATKLQQAVSLDVAALTGGAAKVYDHSVIGASTLPVELPTSLGGATIPVPIGAMSVPKLTGMSLPSAQQIQANTADFVNKSIITSSASIADQQSPVTLSPEVSASRKVYLRSAMDFGGADQRRVDFAGQPKIETTEIADYDIYNPVHAPTGFAAYKGSPLKEISISDIKLFSRTPEEATINLQILNTLRGWTKPYFGLSGSGSETRSASATVAITGAPPDILYFYAYSGDVDGTQDNYYRFPVVLKSISFSYPNDVDYIATISGSPFPIIMPLSLILMETRSPDEVEQFKLEDYREGRMLGW